MELFVVGTGGAGRETLDVALALRLPVMAFLDDKPADSPVRRLPVLRTQDAPRGGYYVIGIADPQARLRLATDLDRRGLVPWALVHPTAVVGPDTTIGAGCVVMAGAHVSSSVRLGQHVHVQYNATIGHDCRLADRVTVLPGANVSGNVELQAGSTVGSGAVVLQGRVVGSGAFVGAGAVVTSDVAESAVVVGSPARPLHRRLRP